MEHREITVTPWKDRAFNLTVSGHTIRPQHSVGDFGGFEVHAVYWTKTGKPLSKSAMRRIPEQEWTEIENG